MADVIIVRSRSGGDHDDHGSGSWKVAFADFAIAMMALFMVLWLVAATNEVQKKSISHYFSNPGIFRKPSSRNPIPMQGATSVHEGTPKPINASPSGKSGFEPAGEESPGLDETMGMNALFSGVNDARGLGGMRRCIQVRSLPKGLMVTIVQGDHGAVFGTGHSDLTPFYEDFVLALSPMIEKLARGVVIVGHSDSSSFHDQRYQNGNWSLGAQRAETVRQTLIFGGVSPNLIIGTTSMGDRAPVQGKPAVDPINRRVDLLILTQKSEKQLLKQWNMIHDMDDLMTQTEVDSAIYSAEANQREI
ncbi:flagellar motor protein MotB [Parendozoicomonas sp. Alg238-R29]|uniref:flagellar motor protein MotB n=1 Tax=Parendozoicomonas sp. Alg238-R29 TaxID=2993446 RepID=UPI00248E22D1|nr:flagellar motor protein MotB [Parendozoicomonas sp. Alg238-R29]